MVDDLASGVQAASAGARVRAPLLNAGLVLRTLRAGHALGPACGRRAYVIFLARAYRVPVHPTALAVRPARRGYARVSRLFGFSYNVCTKYTGL